jgi:hypothetical protein
VGEVALSSFAPSPMPAASCEVAKPARPTPSPTKPGARVQGRVRSGAGPKSPSPRASPIGFGPRSPSPRASPIGFGPGSPIYFLSKKRQSESTDEPGCRWTYEPDGPQSPVQKKWTLCFLASVWLLLGGSFNDCNAIAELEAAIPPISPSFLCFWWRGLMHSKGGSTHSRRPPPHWTRTNSRSFQFFLGGGFTTG